MSTREAWLEQAVEALRPLFAELDVDVPTVRVSVGFAGGKGRNRHHVVGQCWAPSVAADGVGQVFVSPVVADAVEVLDILTHELVHAVNHKAGDAGHGACFSRIAKRLGLTGRMTATVAGPELKAKLQAIAAELGDYPHAALTPSTMSPATKQSTRMIKVVCTETGYTLRTTRKWLDALGAPICPCCDERMEVEL